MKYFYTYINFIKCYDFIPAYIFLYLMHVIYKISEITYLKYDMYCTDVMFCS